VAECVVCKRRDAKPGHPDCLCGKCRSSYWHARADQSVARAMEWAAERARQCDRQQPARVVESVTNEWCGGALTLPAPEERGCGTCGNGACDGNTVACGGYVPRSGRKDGE